MKKLTGSFLKTEYGYPDIHGTNVWFVAAAFQNIFSLGDPFFKQKPAQQPDTLSK